MNWRDPLAPPADEPAVPIEPPPKPRTPRRRQAVVRWAGYSVAVGATVLAALAAFVLLAAAPG